MINKENMRAWVASLRSGKYQQGKEMLTPIGRDGTEQYCCLGVACAISGVAEKDVGENAATWDGADEVLPSSVMEWLGVDTRDPHVSEYDKASAANDDRGLSFGEIADAIESYYELLS